jgi:hypothetical protein
MHAYMHTYIHIHLHSVNGIQFKIVCMHAHGRALKLIEAFGCGGISPDWHAAVRVELKDLDPSVICGRDFDFANCDWLVISETDR